MIIGNTVGLFDPQSCDWVWLSEGKTARQRSGSLIWWIISFDSGPISMTQSPVTESSKLYQISKQRNEKFKLFVKKWGRVLHESCILVGYYGLNANISFTFQVVKNRSVHPTYLFSGLFCKVFGDFFVYLEIESLSQKIANIYSNRKFGRFGVVLKLEFEVKNC